MIQVGDKVVCINGCGSDVCHPAIHTGRMYVVADIFQCTCGLTGISIGIDWLVIPSGERCKCGVSYSTPSPMPMYNIDRFRKIEPEYRVVEVATFIKEETKELIPN